MVCRAPSVNAATFLWMCASLYQVMLAASETIKQTNLLLIMYDDLRPELSIYGRDHMVTPNFERLAARSVVFDYSFCQVAVCNPSRDSLLTGLRPDTVGTYNFQHSYFPHRLLPRHLADAGYLTAASGKILHWPNGDPSMWNFDHWEDNWYAYQNFERGFMNSSTMPDKTRAEDQFKDHGFAERAVTDIRKMVTKPKPFMMSVGFKLPHLELHVPHAYYEIYKNKSSSWALTKKELRYPATASEISYRCCAEPYFKFMNEEGSKRHKKSFNLGDINTVIPELMHDELMMGYCAGVSFLDKQLGKLLDLMDELDLWKNTTVVLTSDHGMMNGEKGIWEKWTLFEEATRVPLLISHPSSPFHGQHYPLPVESVDVYPTLVDLLKLPKNLPCSRGWKCLPLSGKSLAPVVLGEKTFAENFPGRTVAIAAAVHPVAAAAHAPAPAPVSATAVSTSAASVGSSALAVSVVGGNSTVASSGTHNGRMLRGEKAQKGKKKRGSKGGKGRGSSIGAVGSSQNATLETMPMLQHNFALSQTIRCANIKDLKPLNKNATASVLKSVRKAGIWQDCDTNKRIQPGVLSLMGYAMRTPEYRYIAYYHFNMTTFRPLLDKEPYLEELFDHKNETLSDFTHKETVNLNNKPIYAVAVAGLRSRLTGFLKSSVQFHTL